MKTKRFLALLLSVMMVLGIMPMTVFAEEECAHTNTIYTAPVGEPSCFEPAMGGYWFCEDCYQYLDENKQNVYWDENEVRNAVKRFATGHAFNTDTGKCDHCNLANPVYSKVTSLDDVNEEDMYIFVAKVGDKYFVLGGLDESTPDEQGNVWCGDSGNAIEVTPYEDGSISLLNQDYVGTMKPSEFMLDVNPDQWNFTEMGLTTVMPLLPNYCVYSFQSNSLDNTGYMGVPRYGNGECGMWDSSAWILDFYTTVVTDDTYRYEDEFGSKTHAEQVADGNIDENISEGDLLLYKASFYSVGGAMFTLRFREYPNPETGTTEYYFICGEDWALEGSPGWDYVTDTTPTNDTQYAISLYRYDVPSVPAHTCDFGDWVDDKNGDTHTRTCKDSECGKKETKTHDWDDGVETEAPTCTEPGTTTYTCPDCKATKTEAIPSLDHDWGEWAYDSVDSHIRSCKRDRCDAEDYGGHEWGDWTSVDVNTHKMVCALCNGEQTGEHDWDNGVVTKEPTEWEAGIRTYTCGTCSHIKTEPIDKLVHECTWSDWYPNGDENHKRDCLDDNCDRFETLAHGWDNGAVTTEPTYEATGVKTYTCTVCGEIKTETLAMLVKVDEIVSPDNSEIKITAPEGSDAVLHENTVLQADELQEEVSEDVKSNIEKAVEDNNAEILASYDISLLLNGVPVQPGGTVEVTLPAPENAADYDALAVVYIDDDGNVTPCETSVNEDGTVTFVTDHFSRYAIIGVQSGSPLVWILISAISVVLISGSLLAVLVIKKKKGIA